ncbi:MAG: BMP family ABC transporter substrate-binding protein [Sphaerochaetaceae bacterium]
MKRIVSVCWMLVAGCLLFANGQGEKVVSEKKESKNIAICLSTGGLGDKNFNDMAYAGLQQAEKDFGIHFDYFEPATASDFEPSLRQFAERGDYALIIGIGNDEVDAIKTVAADFPDQKFSLIDASLPGFPNVRATATKWQEQTFLCGVYAGLGTLSDMAMANKQNTIGVILGMDFPNLREGMVGFKAGAKYVNPDVEVLEAVIGSFNDPTKGKEIAISMYNRGADFIQPIAGASGLGVFNAAKENGFYVFGVGGNQNGLAPSVVAATSIRNVNEMVYNEVRDCLNGSWKAGSFITGLKEGAVGYSDEGSDVVIPADIKETISAVKQKITDGSLVITNKEEDLDAWVAENQFKK